VLSMGRRNTTLTVALCTSLSVHALALWTLMWWFVHYTPPPSLAALPRPDYAPIIITTPPKPPAPPPPAKPKPPPPPDFSKAMKQPPHDDSGEATGKGTANRSTSGDQPMTAQHGFVEQADLTRNATDDRDKSNLDVVAQAGVKNGTDPSAAAPPSVAYGVAQPSPVPAKSAAPPLIAITDPTKAAGGDSLQQPSVKGSPDAKPTPPTPSTAAPKEIAGHAATSSDTDSMPFTKAGTPVFHYGKLEGRQGRKVKTTRIDVGLEQASGATVLGVSVDAAGNVYDVVVLQTGGNGNVDFICQRTVYNWWFEPGKDKEGHPLADQWVVYID
jgi:hypothetical protein